MRILVTGGAGFIGSEYVRQRLASDPVARITVLDALTYSGVDANPACVADHPGYRFVRGDICDPDRVERSWQARTRWSMSPLSRTWTGRSTVPTGVYHGTAVGRTTW